MTRTGCRRRKASRPPPTNTKAPKGPPKIGAGSNPCCNSMVQHHHPNESGWIRAQSRHMLIPTHWRGTSGRQHGAHAAFARGGYCYRSRKPLASPPHALTRFARAGEACGSTTPHACNGAGSPRSPTSEGSMSSEEDGLLEPLLLELRSRFVRESTSCGSGLISSRSCRSRRRRARRRSRKQKSTAKRWE